MLQITQRHRRPIVVVKLGGSLLERADLRDLLDEVARQRAECSLLWIVGGGAAADVVRGWDAAHHLGDEVAHWLAIEAMGLNESLLLHLLPGSRLVRSGKQLQAAWADGVRAVLCTGCYVNWAEAQGEPALPRPREVTSDSLAAWVAAGLGADELVLLKSTELPAEISSVMAAAAGLVDAWFPQLAGRLPGVSWVNGSQLPAVVTQWQIAPGGCDSV